MKRAADLRGLSEDHHTGLVLARRALKAASEGGAAMEVAWTDLTARFPADLEPHFQIEEQHLAPALEAIGELALASRLLEEHTSLRALIAGGAPRTTATLRTFGELLEKHIRFEEREVFEAAQNKLAPASLAAIAAAWTALHPEPAG